MDIIVFKKEPVWEQISQVSDSINNQVLEQTGNHIWLYTWKHFKNQIGEQIWEQIGSQIRNQSQKEAEDDKNFNT